jgi:hypothetical protein
MVIGAVAAGCFLESAAMRDTVTLWPFLFGVIALVLDTENVVQPTAGIVAGNTSTFVAVLVYAATCVLRC